MNFAFKKLFFFFLIAFIQIANGQVVVQPPLGGGFNSLPFNPSGARPLFPQPPRPRGALNLNQSIGGTPFSPVNQGASSWLGGTGGNVFGKMTPFERPLPSYGFSWNFMGANEQFDLKLSETPDDNSFYSIDNLFGCEVPQDNYNLEVLNNLDFNNKCFDPSSNGVLEANSPERLKNDLVACGCLKDFKNPDVSKIMGIELNQNDIIDVNRRAERLYGAGLNQALSGVAFQSYVLAQNAEEKVRNKFVTDYAKSPFPYDPNNNKVLIEKDGEYSLNLKPEDYSSLGKDKLPLYTPITKADGSTVDVCLSMSAFHRMRQMPAKNDWPHILADLDKDYEPEDWDYHRLQSQYEDIMDDSPIRRLAKKDEIVKLKTKLSFLNRNPVVKYMLGADQKDYDSVTGGGEHTGAIGFDLKQKQTEIFSMLKRTLVRPECSNSPEGLVACGSNLRIGLASIYGNLDHSALIGEIVRADMRDDIVDRARKASKTINKRLPENRLNPQELNSRFEREFNIQRPADCRANTNLENINQSTDQCLKRMSAYCQFLEPYKDQIQNRAPANHNSVIADTLSSELEDDFNTDQNTNEAFQQANQEYCHTPIKKKNSEAKETFFEFMNGHCQNSSNEGCAKQTPDDWEKLRKKYQDLHDFSTVQNSLGNDTQVILVNTEPEIKRTDGYDDEDPFILPRRVDPGCKKFCVGLPADVGNGGSTVVSETTKVDTKKPFFASLGETVKDVSGATNSTGSTQTNDQAFGGNYQTDLSGTTNTTLGSQNLASKEVQDQIVNQLQERIEDVQESNPGSPDLRALQADLAAIRASFAQSQLTNKSLNDKLEALERAQEIMTRNNLAPTAPQQVAAVPSKGRFPSSVPNPRVGLSELDRAISSVRENQNTGAVSNGASVSGNFGGRGRISGGTDASSDAVRREEGKLVNVESTVDGRLTVTTASRGAGVTANALSVEVPMNLYQTIQSNPEGIDLSQIRISDAQMSQVQNREFTLLVNSGDGNPPFKVQVQIKNNRLVRADSNNDGQPDRPVQTVRLNDLNLVFRPIIQAQAN